MSGVSNFSPKELGDKGKAFYEAALVAGKKLKPNSPTLLRAAIAYALLTESVINDRPNALRILKEYFYPAMEANDNIANVYYKEGSQLITTMRDYMTMWSSRY